MLKQIGAVMLITAAMTACNSGGTGKADDKKR